jgi:signal transduction histidine kinase/CheY-like chemotaxis protein/putative methionine-R-sulfoxide reductase with GAF domain
LEVKVPVKPKNAGEKISASRQARQKAGAGLNDPSLVHVFGTEPVEALRYQEVVSDILRVIAQNKQDPQIVFETIVQSALRLCGTDRAMLLLKEGDTLRIGASYGLRGVHFNLSSFLLGEASVVGRAVREKLPTQIQDVSTVPGNVKVFGEYRAVLAVPILLNANVLGIILLLHSTPRSFAPSEIRHLTTFADLASIAIEKARLIDTVQTRDRALTIAFDHQSSTADVLKIIAQSPDKLQSVMEAIASSALRLCEASDVVIERLEGDRFYNAAHAGTHMKGLVGLPLPLTRQFPGGRAVLDRKRVIIEDLMAVAEVEYPDTLELLKINTIHSVAEIPLLSDGQPLGTIAVLRAEHRPFTESEIVLMESFADQAVIAIQNARLFSEIEEKGRLLEAANLHKSQFLATMSHEIRTPMNGIMGMANLLQRTSLDHEQSDFVQTMLRSSETLLSVIDDILDFSKIESGKLELESVTMNLASVAESALDIVAPVAAKKGVELIYALDAGLPTDIKGDPLRLRQVLLNLLHNAIKFTEVGEVELVIRAQGMRDDQIQIMFEVRDTGIGIPGERLDRLFKSFSQVDASATRRFGGTGLGLAISQSLVQLMGGTITVDSTVGAGSMFQFKLNFDFLQTVQPEAKQPQPSLDRKQILIVDDNSASRLLLERHVRQWKMLPLSFASGQDALQYLASGGIADIALFDMVMPEVTGIDLVRAIRASSPAVSFPIILLSSLDSDTFDQVQQVKALFSAIVSKPIKPTVLCDAIVLSLTVPVEGMLQTDMTSHIKSGTQMAAPHAARILLVDDHGTNRKFGLALLTRLGYQANIASSGAEALAMCQDNVKNFDVILMDIEMPDMDGIEAIRHIRNHATHGCPYLIALTANAIVGDREKYLAAGFDDYVSKPIRVEELEAALDRARSSDAAARVN